jgi:hypothetical protein
MLLSSSVGGEVNIFNYVDHKSRERARLRVMPIYSMGLHGCTDCHDRDVLSGRHNLALRGTLSFWASRRGSDDKLREWQCRELGNSGAVTRSRRSGSRLHHRLS